jgi:hypothetical protein
VSQLSVPHPTEKPAMQWRTYDRLLDKLMAPRVNWLVAKDRVVAPRLWKERHKVNPSDLTVTLERLVLDPISLDSVGDIFRRCHLNAARDRIRAIVAAKNDRGRLDRESQFLGTFENFNDGGLFQD